MIANVTTGIKLNSLVDVKDVLSEILRTEFFKHDFIAPRKDVRFTPTEQGVTVTVKDDGPFHPTKTGLVQMAELSSIPKRFLLDTEKKYPELAADLLSHWFLDNSAANKTRKKPVPAAGINQLFRCYSPNNETPGVLRAVRSQRYRILDNSDIAATVLSAISGNDGVGVTGTVSDDKLYLVLTNWALKKDLKVGDTVLFRVRISNSETGCSSLSVIPQVVVLSCLNGATVGRDLVKMHLGEKLTHEDLLTRETLNL